jgi:hypothetical protein
MARILPAGDRVSQSPSGLGQQAGTRNAGSRTRLDLGRRELQSSRADYEIRSRKSHETV